MEWIIKANINLILFAVLYQILFYSSGKFDWSRVYLIFMPLLSVALAFSTNYFPTQPIQFLPVNMHEITLKADQINTVSSNFSLLNLITLLYFSGFSISLIHTSVGLYRIRHIRINTAFSFFNTIYLPETEVDKQRMMHLHEEAHVKQRHSIDILFYECAKAFFWFNPVVYLMQRNLKEVHEYAADAYAVKDTVDRVAYCELILDHTFHGGSSTLVNAFHNQTTLLNRIKMITQDKPKKMAGWRYLTALPILAIALVISMSGPSVFAQEKLKAAKTADVMPAFKGGQEGLSKYLGEKLIYPDECKQKKLEGQVILQFIVDTKGMVKNINNLSKPEVNELFVKEATRVVGAMQWTPGKNKGKAVNVEIVLPIRFRL